MWIWSNNPSDDVIALAFEHSGMQMTVFVIDRIKKSVDLLDLAR